MAFEGFGDGLVEFFSELEDHNERSWWQANKERHRQIVGDPMKALAAELEAKFGPVKVFRPYRDIRFSADKRPLQEHASMAAGGEGPALYLQVDADGMFLAGGLYQPARPQLEAFRALLDEPRSAAGIHRRLATLAGKGFEMGEPALKSAPRGYRKDHPEIELLRHTSLTVGTRLAPGRWLSTRAAYDRVVDAWGTLAAWNAWLAERTHPEETGNPA